MNGPQNIQQGGNAAQGIPQNPDSRLPDFLRNVQVSAEPGICNITQSRSSVGKPLNAREVYHEKQANPNTCGLHALRHYVGTQWVALDYLNRIAQGMEMWQGAIDEAYNNFVAALGPSSNFLPNVYADPRQVEQAIENITRLLVEMEREKRVNDWKGILEDMQTIRIILTDNGRVPLPRASSPLSAIDGYIDQVQGSINLADMSRRGGADPVLIRNVLAAIDPEAELVEPRTWGLGSQRLNLSDVCGELDARGADRAIICGSGHFIALRKTTNDDWCIVDSEKNDVIPVNRRGKDRSSVEGRPFYGVILSSEGNLADKLAGQLAHY
ncbi:MAG: hypothetical protein LBF42_02295 [Puniceicoccales bacterium]|nr:hypothetical protein [Puniceicoccales bacterium]